MTTCATRRSATRPAIPTPTTRRSCSAVPRAPQRAEIGIDGALPFTGADGGPRRSSPGSTRGGKPQVAIARSTCPSTSPRIVESKSVKLYLASFAQTRFADARRRLRPRSRATCRARDRRRRCASRRRCRGVRASRAELAGERLDDAARRRRPLRGRPDAAARGGARRSTRRCTRDLFRSVCPVTGQPDYASIAIALSRAAHRPRGAAAYLVSFRRHAGFHEHCVERIFVDMLAALPCRRARRRRALHAPRRHRHQSVPHQRGHAACRANVRTPRQ